MFGLRKRESATATTTSGGDAASRAPASAEPGLTPGKGRPTPSRREAEQRNHRPIVSAPTVSANASKAERKAAKQAERAQWSQQRTLQRQAMVTGDERNLPARDQGAHRRWARDYVDARRNVAEYFLPLGVVVMLATVTPVYRVQLGATIVLYVFVAVAAVDSLAFLRRRVVHEVEIRFPGKGRQVGTYAIMRSLQLRRLRMPRAQVARGQYPK